MKNKKVLIVDDNALNRKVFENIIGYSFFFEVAANGLDALEKIRNTSFDIILMDIQMPKLDGISALKIIREDQLSDAPVLAISAYSSPNDRDYFLSLGFDDFLAKPVRPKDLLQAIQHHTHLPSVPAEGEHAARMGVDLDEAIISQLLKYNSTENIRTVYLDFLEEAERLIEEIKYFIENKRYNEIGEKIHILKGNSGTLGAQNLYYSSSSFEDKIKLSEFEGIKEAYFLLEKHLNNFRNNLRDQKIFNL
ncbi:MAG TPA: response regulator [Cyclobacteriaceae bacterium]|nr:response regulator [Cyclobacteriaceae bacterium]